VAPHANGQGDYAVGTLLDGTSTEHCGGEHGCPPIPWPGNWKTADGLVFRPAESWFGSIVSQKADASGLHYKRNRYYDPATGRFTQEDPIGLAGGLNLYGYANGDPVNFNDPFGLSAQACCRTGSSFLSALWDEGGRQIRSRTDRIVVGASGTLGNAGVSASAGAVTGVQGHVVVNSPHAGGSLNIGVQYRQASPNEVRGSTVYGLSPHLGVSVDNETVRLNVGVSTPTVSPVTVEVQITDIQDSPQRRRPLLDTPMAQDATRVRTQ
jgi:RHS repeat-associated protein